MIARLFSVFVYLVYINFDCHVLSAYAISSIHFRWMRASKYFPIGSDPYIFPALNTARPNKRTNDCIGNNERERSVSRYRPATPRRVAWYLERGWPLARSAAKTLLFSSPGPRTPAPAESEGEDDDARQPARNWFAQRNHAEWLPESVSCF